MLSDSIYDEDTNTISLSLRFGSAGDNVFNVDGNFVGQLIAYEAWCMVSYDDGGENTSDYIYLNSCCLCRTTCISMII